MGCQFEHMGNVFGYVAITVYFALTVNVFIHLLSRNGAKENLLSLFYLEKLSNANSKMAKKHEKDQAPIEVFLGAAAALGRPPTMLGHIGG